MQNNNELKSILLIAANPKGTPSLRLQEEEREIKSQLRSAGYGKVPINSTGAARPKDVQQAMLDFEPQVVHFTGHGGGPEGLFFEDITGQSKLVSSESLASLFKLFSAQVECVVLNSCYSEFQAEAIAQHVRYVIGMNQAIGDRAAIEFAIGFYKALGAGRTIESAFELGRNAIQMADIPEHLTPVLFTQKKVDIPQSKLSITISEQIKEEKENLKQLKISNGLKEEIEASKETIRKLERKREKNPELEKGFLLSERYELLEVIDTGGFATVWKAYDESEDGHGVVAIKVLHGHYAKVIG